MKKKKAFTLIELIAVLVILAILALIVTPLVMNIIKKARISADKRSVDAYGRSIELAIASYLLDEGKFPSSINELTIEYSGDEVVCSTTQLNGDSSVYLTGCTVGGRSVDYTYGSDKSPTYTAYTVGDHISYNGINYYVIENSDTTNDTVKLLKETPLTKTEIDDLNLSGITIDESNKYGDGAVQYGSSKDYETSTVKQIVDAWKNTAVKSGDIATARLITFDEVHSFGYGDTLITSCGGACNYYEKPDELPDWVYNSNYWYWTMSANKVGFVWFVRYDGALAPYAASSSHTVRPVIELNKNADITKLAS